MPVHLILTSTLLKFDRVWVRMRWTGREEGCLENSDLENSDLRPEKLEPLGCLKSSRVATVREKAGKIRFYSRSGKSQGKVREFCIRSGSF